MESERMPIKNENGITSTSVYERAGGGNMKPSRASSVDEFLTEVEVLVLLDNGGVRPLDP
jgi:hypothetical protein